MVLRNILALCIVSQHVAHELTCAWCSQFVSSFQGYEGSLIKLTSKQVCNVFLVMPMNLRIRASVSLSPCCHCSYSLKLLLINTSHFLASLLTYAPLPPDYEELAPSDRKYLKKEIAVMAGRVLYQLAFGSQIVCLQSQTVDPGGMCRDGKFFFEVSTSRFFFFSFNKSHADSCVLSPGAIRTENELSWKVSMFRF